MCVVGMCVLRSSGARNTRVPNIEEEAMASRPFGRKSIIAVTYFAQLLLIDCCLLHVQTTHSFTPPILTFRHNLYQLPLNWIVMSSIGNAETMEVNAHDDFFLNITKAPYIAIVTEPYACDNDESYEATMKALYHAISTNYVNFISIRLTRNILIGKNPISSNSSITSDGSYQENIDEIQFQSRYTQMIQQLREWSEYNATTATKMNRHHRRFYVIVSSGPYMELGLRHYADGVHFKEMHQSRIPSTRQFYRTLLKDDESSITADCMTPRRNPKLLVGTSVHSIASAIDAYTLYQPEYMFVGTCYTTQSHPDKLDVEGPLLPSQVCDALHRCMTLEQQSGPASPPLILGIGGIDDINCGIVVNPHRITASPAIATTRASGTCDGVAVIRSVLQSIDPAQTVRSMHHCMRSSLTVNHEYDISGGA
jgi:Thiamine monophosphate synthase